MTWYSPPLGFIIMLLWSSPSKLTKLEREQSIGLHSGNGIGSQDPPLPHERSKMVVVSFAEKPCAHWALYATPSSASPTKSSILICLDSSALGEQIDGRHSPTWIHPEPSMHFILISPTAVWESGHLASIVSLTWYIFWPAGLASSRCPYPDEAGSPHSSTERAKQSQQTT